MMERRLEQRHPLRVGVRVRDRSGRVFSLPTRNISPGGAFIETGPVDLSSEGVLWVDLPDPDAEGGWNDVASLVVHHRPDGIGVMFSYPYAALKRLSGPQHRPRQHEGHAALLRRRVPYPPLDSWADDPG